MRATVDIRVGAENQGEAVAVKTTGIEGQRRSTTNRTVRAIEDITNMKSTGERRRSMKDQARNATKAAARSPIGTTATNQRVKARRSIATRAPARSRKVIRKAGGRNVTNMLLRLQDMFSQQHLSMLSQFNHNTRRPIIMVHVI